MHKDDQSARVRFIHHIRLNTIVNIKLPYMWIQEGFYIRAIKIRVSMHNEQTIDMTINIVHCYSPEQDDYVH